MLKDTNKVALVVIFCIPILWGLGFVVTHNAVGSIHAGVYAFLRTLVTFLVLLPFTIKGIFKAGNSHQNRNRNIATGFLFGLLICLQILGHSHALVTLPSATAAFIVSLNVVLVVGLSLLIQGKRPNKLDITAIVLGLVGAYFILNPSMQPLTIGYAWAGLAALAIALMILLIGHISALGLDGDSQHSHQDQQQNRRRNQQQFIFFQSLFCMLLLSYYPLNFSIPDFTQVQVWLAILYMGVFATALTTLAQVKFQSVVGNTRAALIFNLDVVFASLFALLNGEHFTLYQAVGGVLIFAASIVHSLYQFIQKTNAKRALS